MKHSYILEEGIWKASGKYYDENQTCIGISGETKISHKEDTWILDGFMELSLDTPVRFTNRYSIDPIDSTKDFTFWFSINPALGKLLGKFMIIGDTILSSYTSEDGQYSGSESLIFVESELYKNRGFALHNRNKLSSWEVDLNRITKA